MSVYWKDVWHESVCLGVRRHEYNSTSRQKPSYDYFVDVKLLVHGHLVLAVGAQKQIPSASTVIVETIWWDTYSF